MQGVSCPTHQTMDHFCQPCQQSTHKAYFLMLNQPIYPQFPFTFQKTLRYRTSYKPLTVNFNFNSYLLGQNIPPTCDIQIDRQPLNSYLHMPISVVDRPFNHMIVHRPFNSMTTTVDFLNHAQGLTDDPVRLFSHLRPLEQIITRKLQRAGISFSNEDHPTYVIGLRGMVMPGMQPTPLKPKIGRILEESLREYEAGFGINQFGTPIFVGFVQKEMACNLIKLGYVFKEDPQASRMLLHGANTHRLYILALMHSLGNTPFLHLTGKEVLEFFIECKLSINNEEPTTAWDTIFDNITVHVHATSTDPREQLPSCTSPFIMNGELLTNASKYGLPNLGFCMRNEHTKQLLKMISRVNQIPRVAIQDVYDALTMELDHIAGNVGALGVRAQFSLTKEELCQKPSYAHFMPRYANTNIKRKLMRAKKPLPLAWAIKYISSNTGWKVNRQNANEEAKEP